MPSMTAPKLLELMAVEQAAVLLGVHPGSLYRMARARRVPCIRIGRLIRFDPRALEKFLKQNAVDVQEAR